MRITSFPTSFLRPISLPSLIKPRPRFTASQTQPPQFPSLEAHSQPPASNHLRTPYDLVRFRKSIFTAHLSELKLRNKLPAGILPDTPSLLDDALTSAGQAHEERVVQHILNIITSQNPTLHHQQIIYRVPFASPDRFSLTQQAILRRTPLILGAALRDDTFTGYADMLILNSLDPFQEPSRRSSQASSYTVCEIKLSEAQHPDYAIQAAVYTALLSSLLSRMNIDPSNRAYLWLGSPKRPPTTIQSSTLHYLYKRTRQDFCAFLEAFNEDEPLPMPDAPLDRLSPWSTYAQQVLEDTDSLLLVANIRRAQAAEIEAVMNVNTLQAFAEINSKDVDRFIKTSSVSPVVKKLHKQAKMQYATRQNGGSPIAYALVRPENKLFVLPAASTADMYFDMEGFPLMHDGGLEYLFGVKMASSADFKFWWAHDREQEEDAFIGLMNWIKRVLKGEHEAGRSPPHIFHYGHYEVSALRRLAMRATTDAGHAATHFFESLVEDGRFVDIYSIVKRELVVGESSYSIKKVERLVGISREGDELADAESSVGMYYNWRENYLSSEHNAENSEDQTEENGDILDEILKYNEQDCESLQQVVSWLRDKLPCGTFVRTNPANSESSEGVEKNETETRLLPGACGATSELKLNDSSSIQRSMDLSSMLLQSKNDISSEVRQTLSNLLHFYVLESAPVRREFYERVKAAFGSSYDVLMQDDECLSLVKFIGTTTTPGVGKRAPKTLYKYTFSLGQPCVLSSKSNVAFVTPFSKKGVNTNDIKMIACFMAVKSIEGSGKSGMGVITLSAGRKENFIAPKSGSLVCSDGLSICNGPLRQSVLRSAERIAGNCKNSKVSLVEAFLRRKQIDEEDFDGSLKDVMRTGDHLTGNLSELLASRKESCALVIQGPPGSGKTFLSGNLISQLVMQYGKRVAVSSNSHAAIDNLLSSCIRAGVTRDVVWKVGTRSRNNDGRFKQSIGDIKLNETQKGVLIGATCYQLSREDSEGRFDFLFIDEASQVATANFIAMAPCAHYAVLVGDQQQLEMPIKGAHIGASGTSCLSYIVGESATVPIEHGLFLDTSYRMHPRICSFISNSFYDGALSHAPSCCDNELILGRASNLLQKRSGISFLASDEYHNTAKGSSKYGTYHVEAEVSVIQELIPQLLNCQVKTSHNDVRDMSMEDILIVAPYNAQVSAIRDAVPDARVGTVDKFQGAQAAVTIISTCTRRDESEEADENERQERKGLRFSLKENRINVAVSRAQCVAVIVGWSKACRSFNMVDLNDVRLVALYEMLQEAD